MRDLRAKKSIIVCNAVTTSPKTVPSISYRKSLPLVSMYLFHDTGVVEYGSSDITKGAEVGLALLHWKPDIRIIHLKYVHVSKVLAQLCDSRTQYIASVTIVQRAGQCSASDTKCKNARIKLIKR